MRSLTKVTIIVAGGLLVCGLTVMFLISPVLKDVTAINIETKEKKLELSVLRQQIQAFKNAQADLTKATRKDEIVDAIVMKEDLVLPVQDLEAAAAATGTRHDLLIREPTVRDKPILNQHAGIDEIPYVLNATNNFQGMVDFLSYLEHLPHFTEISKITLSAESVQSQAGGTLRSGNILGDFSGIFFIKSVPKAPAAAKPSAGGTAPAED